MTMIFRYITSALLLASFISCSDDFLDVELKNTLGVDSYYTTKEHAIGAVTSCYEPIKQRGLFAQNYQYLLYALEDRIINENSSLNEFAFTASNGTIGGDPLNFSVWDHLYRGIFRTNLALEKIPGIVFEPEEVPAGYDLKTRLLAEARFMRAMYNFYLVVHFNEPIYFDFPAYDMNEPYTNSPQVVFWNSIEADLLFAISHLPNKSEYASSDLGRATKGAAMALLGKSYLYQERWEEAEQYFQLVIDSEQYSLNLPVGEDSTDFVYAYLSNFSYMDLKSKSGNTYRAEHNSESIFEICNTYSTENVINPWNPGFQSDGSNFAVWFGTLGFKNVVPTAEMVGQYENTSSGLAIKKDPRRYASIYSAGDTIESWNTIHPHYNKRFNYRIHSNVGISEGYGLKKYLYPSHYTTEYGVFIDPTNWRLIRYADLLLMYAEACYHTGNTGPGLNALNQVRRRAGLPDVPALTPQAIMHERDIELFGECSRFLDLVRWLKLPEPWISASDIHPNFVVGKHEYLPIPEVDIVRLGGSLKQNPGW